MTRQQPLLISGVRTAIGAFGGALATVPATQLGADCIQSALHSAAIPPDNVDEVIMGNVVSAGLGQNPARQAMIRAGLPTAVAAMTVNKVCGSGLKAVMLAAQSIQLGESEIVVAGGMENMSLAPYLATKARAGYRMGHGQLVDSMIHDGLWDVYGDQHMGVYGDKCAAKFAFSRKQQDAFAVRSYTRALDAQREGVFASEIQPVTVQQRGKQSVVEQDEELSRFDEEKLRALRPAFGEEGTVTAGNASSINDGAAALTVVSESSCERLSLKPLARIVGWATFSQDPEWFTTAPISAMRRLLERMQWTVEDIDLFEINEAFAVVAMAAAKELEIPDDKLNIFGGAVALGHPIGCTGARLLVTLLTGLRKTGGRRGVACLCIGGGEAVALAVERVDS